MALLTIYSDANYKGERKELNGDFDVRDANDPWNDRISSIEVAQGYVAWMFWDYRFNSPIYPAVRGKWSVSGGGDIYNDQISSIKLVKDGGITIFVHQNYMGRSHFLNEDIADLRDISFNDSISSVLAAKDYRFTAYRDINYRKPIYGPKSRFNVGGNRDPRNDTISSLKIIKP